MSAAPLPVRAAGVVLTRGEGAAAQALVLYRPMRRDWSLPKGKLDVGEHVVVAAVRECDEETGIVPALRIPLGRQRYTALGRPKTVDYWQAHVAHDHGFVPDEEVAEVRWVGAEEAAVLLTYRRDVELVRHALTLPETSPLILLRHGTAMARADFTGKDEDRPLTGKGRSQARDLVPMLQAYGVEHVHSSDSARCTATVWPFARHQRLAVEQEPIFSEPGYAQVPKAAKARFEGMLRDGRPAALCTHRPVLPGLLEVALDYASGPAKQLLRAVMDNGLNPGDFVVLHRTLGSQPRIVAAEQARSRRGEHVARSSLAPVSLSN